MAATDFLAASSLFSRMTGCAELYRAFAAADDGGGFALGNDPEMQTWRGDCITDTDISVMNGISKALNVIFTGLLMASSARSLSSPRRTLC